jgi:hypothetical protein
MAVAEEAAGTAEGAEEEVVDTAVVVVGVEVVAAAASAVRPEAGVAAAQRLAPEQRQAIAVPHLPAQALPHERAVVRASRRGTETRPRSIRRPPGRWRVEALTRADTARF